MSGSSLNHVWKKNIKGLEFSHLSSSRNGSEIIFVGGVTSSEFKVPKEEVIIAVSNKADGYLADWKVQGTIQNLLASSSFKELLLETKQNKILFYPDWQRIKKPAAFAIKGQKAVLSQEGESLATEFKTTSSNQVLLYGKKGLKDTISLPLEEEIQNKIFPFIKFTNYIFITTKSGNIYLFEGARQIWHKKLDFMPYLVSSTLLKSNRLILASQTNPAKLIILDINGQKRGSLLYPGKVDSLSCSTSANICAIYENGLARQGLAIFSTAGTFLWNYQAQGHNKTASKVLITEDGNLILAGFQDDKVDYLAAWSQKGKPLWKIDPEGGLKDFQVAGGGESVVVLTKKNELLFYNLIKQTKPALINKY